MPWIYMTKEQITNANTFLNRVQLAGSEAEPFVLIRAAINNSTPDSDLKKIEKADRSEK